MDAENVEFWRQVKSVAADALERPEPERDRWVRDVCQGDPAKISAVLRLLGFADVLDEGTQAMDPHEGAPTIIGRYHLLQKIGEGGMGEVWLAEQNEPVRRRVAVKVVKPGMNSREVIARFESERQALALMDHPAIAKVFDAGSTPQGAPYFVMEYVAGVPITTYCDNHRLSTDGRLELFIHVCEGVQHAHQKAIIHRDLKPSNILVAEVDGHAAPTIIDFGVAKALIQKLSAETMFTRLGALVGTPEYMSPEQANSSGEDIDTRTDVYSLGTILYELLAGAPPLDMRKVPFDEFLRRLREDEPPKPSTKVRTLDQAASTAMANKRQTEPRALAKQIRGDLDSIVMKALEKDRTRRYGSPSDFATDIRRYLNHEAVLAVAPSAVYRFRKFARRYRVALATVCAFVLVLMLAAGVSIRQSLRATKERDRADREAAAARAVNDFLQNDLLAQASANNQSRPAGSAARPDPDLKVRTALDRAAARIPGKFDRQPEVEAAIRDTIGQTYGDLGQYPEARKHLERAVDLYRRVLGAENPRTLSTMRHLAMIAWLQGKFPEAEALYKHTQQIQRRVLGPEHPETLLSMYGLASIYSYQGKFPEAEALYNHTQQIQRRVLGPEHPATLLSMYGLSSIYYYQGKYSEAEALLSKTLEIQRRVLGPEHPATLLSMNGLAGIYYYRGRYSEAEALYDQTLEAQRRIQGPEHFDTLASMYNLALTYNQQGKYADAESLYTQTLEIQRRVLGSEHPDTLSSMNNLALTYSHAGKYAQAEALFRKTLEVRRRVLGPEHPGLLATFSDMAGTFQQEGKYDLAERYAAQSLAGRRHTLGPEHPDTMDAAADLVLAYQSQEKFEESEPLAREAVDVNRKKRPDDWQRFRAESLLGASLAGQKKYADAEPLLLEGYQGMVARKERIAVPEWHHLDRTREWIVQLYQAWGKPTKAAEWRKK